MATDPPANPPARRSRGRLPWAQLLRRVLFVDGLRCPHCTTPMVVLAFLSDPTVVARILTHLGLPSRPPPIAPARVRDTEEAFFETSFLDAEAPVEEIVDQADPHAAFVIDPRDEDDEAPP